MPRTSFTKWLEYRVQEVSDTGILALTIAHAGTAGVTLDQLRKGIGSSRETIEIMLRALVIARQVVMVKVSGELRYRAAG